MAKIKEDIEQKIKDAANIVDVISEDLGVELHRAGTEYTGLCPFHADKHLGSFKVNERKNIATCFSCCKTWHPIDALMEGLHMDYPTALRHLAARYHIWIDDEPVPVVKPAAPRKAAARLPMIYFRPGDVVKPYLGNEDQNPLLQYLYALPMTTDDKARLMLAVRSMYYVGTSTKGDTAGWTIWWQIDDQMRVRTGKLMAYKADGHRDKNRPAPWAPNDPNKSYSFNFVHSMLAKAKVWDDTKYEYYACLFGLHLVDAFKQAEVCIVESEKSALICQAFCDPEQRLWMATGGKQGLSRERLQPLIDRNRYIVLYPDYDGYKEWTEAAERIGYPRLSISEQVRKYHVPSDGDKADMADIMLRLVCAPQETEAEKIARQLGHPEKAEALQYMMDKLNLERV